MTDLTLYAGRWVALIQGHVAGVGETPEVAWQFARHSRPKERILLRYVEAPMGEELPLPPLLAALRPFLADQEQPVYLVGGAVRDVLSGRPVHDLDFVVPEQAIRLAFRAADFLGMPAYVLDQERDAGRVVLREANTTLDFSRFRGPTLSADLQDRDFTINAMALPATAVFRESVLDPLGGLPDLAARHLRLAHPLALQRDPVRTLRALRQSLELEMVMTPETRTAVSQSAPLLTQASTERVRDEVLKLVGVAQPERAIGEMAALGLLSRTLPEIAALEDVGQSAPHTLPVLAHTRAVLMWLNAVETAVFTSDPLPHEALNLVRQALARYAAGLAEHLARGVDGGINGRLLLRLGALFHDVGKRPTQTIDEDGRIRFLGHETAGAELTAHRLRQLTLSNQAVRHVESIVAGHMRPLLLLNAGGLPSRRAIYRYFRDTHTAGLDIGLLTLADHLGTYGGPGPVDKWAHLLAIVARLYDHYFDHHADTVAPPPLVDGRDLITHLHLPPGPEIGRLLRLIQEAQAAGEILTRDEALEFAWRCRQ